jgi:hypothetical protein
LWHNGEVFTRPRPPRASKGGEQRGWRHARSDVASLGERTRDSEERGEGTAFPHQLEDDRSIERMGRNAEVGGFVGSVVVGSRLWSLLRWRQVMLTGVIAFGVAIQVETRV